MDRREFLATTGTGAALLSLSASASAQTGPAGAGQARHVIDITDFGIAAGDADGLAASNSAAVDKLLAHLLAGNPTPKLAGAAAIRITAPAGHFRFARPWVVKFALWLEGQSNSHRWGYATHFDFDTAGFQFHARNTNAGGLEDPPTTGADGFRLENIYCSSRAAAGSGHHGIHAAVRGDVIRCTAENFPGDGIRIESLTSFGASGSNANSARILYCQAGGNGGCGIRLMNGDANCIVTVGCDVHRNGEFGLFDNAFLSNSHTGHHAEGNGLGLAYAGHKMGVRGAACTYPVAPWASGATIAISTAGTYRTSGGKLYRLMKPGGGTTANAPTHRTAATSAPAVGADGYQWAYEGTTLYRRYHVAIDKAAAASTTTPGTNSAVWVPYEWDTSNGTRRDIPVWTSGLTWKEGGAYGGSSQAGETVWTACYLEGDGQPYAQIGLRQVWIGGQSGLSPWSSCIQVKAAGPSDGLSNPGGFVAAKPFHDGGELTASFGSDIPAGRVIRIQHSTLHAQPFLMRTERDTDFYLDGQPSTYLTMTGPTTTFTGGRTAAQPGVLNVPRLFLGAAANARNIDYGSQAPTSGDHSAGEVVFNIAPTAGGKVGWVCTAAGKPGTWKAFGEIEP